MSKVKIVQMTMACDSDGNEHAEYLDDKGRIWRDNGHTEIDEARSERDQDGNLTKSFHKWVPKWEQVDLPKEPEADL